MYWIEIAHFLVIIHVLLAKPRRFYHMVDQRLESHERDILNGTLHSFEACALLCMKYENCTSFSYRKTTMLFSLSSAFPVYTSNSTTPDNSFPEVFMKAQETFSIENGMNFTHINRELADNIPRQAMAGKFSVKACAKNCAKYNGCTGFTYFSIATKCVLTVSNLTTTEQGAVETWFDSLTYSLTRKEDIVPSYPNIARGKPTSQSTTYSFYYDSSYGVNGILTDATSTNSDMQPYWMVNLQAVCTVVGVRVFNNEDWGLARYPIYSPIVYVAMSTTITYTSNEGDIRTPHLDHAICNHLGGNVELVIMNFTCPTPLTGQYVIIDSYGGGIGHYLYFEEFEVYGYC